MTAFQVQHSTESVQVTFDRKYFSEDELLKLLNFLRVEFLAKKWIENDGTNVTNIYGQHCAQP